MANISKKDQIKVAITSFLNKKVGSVSRTDIDKKVKDLGSARTITRALAELKIEGLVIFTKDEGKTAGLWTGTEAKKSSKKKDTKKNADKKNSAGASTKTKSTKKAGITKDDLKKAGKKGEAAKTGTTEKPEKKKGKKKPGVIATIIKSISKKPKTKKQILAKLVKKFPERDADKMMKTINVQVPSRLRKDKELNIQKSDKGYLIADGKWKAPKK